MFSIEVASWKLSALNTDFPAPLKINTEENNKCRGWTMPEDNVSPIISFLPVLGSFFRTKKH